MMWLLSLIPAKSAIKAFFRSWRPEMYALVAVTAVAGIASVIIGNLYISGQKERIAVQAQRISDLTQINKDWQENYKKQIALRENDRAAVLELQEKVTHMDETSSNTEKQLAELRQTNEEIRNILNQPIPPELMRLLK